MAFQEHTRVQETCEKGRQVPEPSDPSGPPLDSADQLQIVSAAEIAKQAVMMWQLSVQYPTMKVKIVVERATSQVTPTTVVEDLSAIPRERVEAVHSGVLQDPDGDFLQDVAAAAMSALIAFHAELTRCARQNPRMPIGEAVQLHGIPAYQAALELFGVTVDDVERLRRGSADS